MENFAPFPTISIRTIQPGDRAALMHFYDALSEDSLHLRFHGASRGIGDGTAGFFCGPDHEHREGLVAVLDGPDRPEPAIVGHLCLDPSGPNELEMAVAVAEAWQRRGIGSRLLMAAIDWAAQHEIGRMRASMLMSNAAILGLLRSVGRPFTLTMPSSGVVDACIDISTELPSAA